MGRIFSHSRKKINETITVKTDKKIQFRDTGIYIYSNADGKLTISSDGTGADDIILNGNVTCNNDLAITGTFSFGAGSFTTLAATGNVTLGDANTDTVTIKGGVVGDGTQNPNFDYSSSTGTFKTSTGTNTIGGTVSLVADKNIACVAGTTAIDWSLGTGVFKTTTGEVTLGGNVTISGTKTLTTGTGAVSIKGDVTCDANIDIVTSGTGYFQGVNAQLTNIKAHDGTACLDIADTTAALGVAGSVTIAANKNISCAAGTTAVDWSGGTGTFKTTTGENTLGGNVTISGSKTFTTGTGAVSIKGDVTCDANIDIVTSGTGYFQGVSAQLTNIKAHDGTAAITIADSTGNVTCAGDLTVSGTHTFNSASITGDLDIVGTDLQATTGTLNISKSGSMTTVKGTLNVDEAVTLDTTLTVAGATTLNGTTTLGNAKADTNTFTGDVAASGVSNPDIDFSGSSGAFKTTTGAVTIGGNTTISGAGTFTTGTGAVGINGSVTLATTKTYTSGSGSTIGGVHTIYRDGAGNSAFTLTPGTSLVIGENTSFSGAETFGTGTGAVSLNGSVVLATAKTYTSGTGSAIGGVHTIYRDGSGNSAFTLTPGTSLVIGENTSFSGAQTFGTGTGAVSLNGSVVLATAKTYTSGTGSAIGGVHTIYRDGAGNSAFTLTPGTSLVIGENTSFSGAETFSTGTGAVSLNGSTVLATAKTYTSGTGSAIGGVHTIYRDGAGNTSVVITPGTSIVFGDNVSISGAYTFSTGTGTTTIGGDYTITGHYQNQEFTANAFQCPASGTDWTHEQRGVVLAANKAAKKCWIPLNFLKIGDEIVSYKLVGDVTEGGGDTVTVDCKLSSINKADPLTTTDVAGGSITQVTANGNFDSEATLSAVETVATDKQYVLEILATTSNVSGTEEVIVIGAEVKVNRKT